MSPQRPLIRIFHFQKKKTFLVPKDPPMGIFVIKPIPFLKITKEFFVQWGGKGGIAGCCERVTFDIIFIMFMIIKSK